MPGQEIEELQRSVAKLGTRLDQLQPAIERLASAAIPAKAVEEKGEEVAAGKTAELRDRVRTLENNVQPVLNDLKEVTPTLRSICELYPDLCELAKERKERATAAAPSASTSKTPSHVEAELDAHQAINAEIARVSTEVLGRPATWGDLLDLCPDGHCAEAAVRAVAKRPKLLEYLVSQGDTAKVLIEALKKAGKLVIEPPSAPAEAGNPPSQAEEVEEHERGVFARRAG